MPKITHVEIRIERGGKIKEKRITESDVLAENAGRMVLDDHYYTRLDKEKGKYNSCPVPEHVSISRNNERGIMEDLFGFIAISVYSFKSLKEIEALINRKFAAYIQKELGYFGEFQGLKIKL